LGLRACGSGSRVSMVQGLGILWFRVEGKPVCGPGSREKHTGRAVEYALNAGIRVLGALLPGS